MRLKRFRILDFRTLTDSGWIDVNDVTSLVGENESGKTNVLLPLWKLNPSGEGGEIDLLADFPRARYHDAKALSPDKLPIFIAADFTLDGDLAQSVADSTGVPLHKAIVRVQRKYNGEYIVLFLDPESNEPLKINESGEEGETSRADELTKAVIEAMPRFLYYSNYGNLDSEIYLPHVVANLDRIKKGEKLGDKEKAKARTLKVLFNFVNLSPDEILELGKPAEPQNGNPTEQQIADAAQRTKEREVLLSSASSDLTTKFANWWKQGNHKIRFQADGRHFRIWVSDSIRPAEVELESRSSGFQWFFSFFLVFLVERADQHKNTILLLDEPGVSLHPLAQKALIEFFENLSKENQIIYTSHSPFLLDHDQLDQVKVVYVNSKTGETMISANLRAADTDKERSKSVYAVFAALGLSTSESLLLTAAPVIVEGITDQWYLGLAKNVLIQQGKINPARDIVFVPGGGARGIKTVAAILAASEEYPPVLLDSDDAGNQVAKVLKESIYAENPAYVSQIMAFTDIESSEIEDLMPGKEIAFVVTRLHSVPAEDFSDVYDPAKPLVPQVRAFATKHSIELPEDWKVPVAKGVVQRLRNKPDLIDDATVDRWKRLFDVLVKQTNNRTETLGQIT